MEERPMVIRSKEDMRLSVFENSKFQHPTSKETPSPKFQAPTALGSPSLEVGAWSFFGCWRLEFGISLRLFHLQCNHWQPRILLRPSLLDPGVGGVVSIGQRLGAPSEKV